MLGFALRMALLIGAVIYAVGSVAPHATAPAMPLADWAGGPMLWVVVMLGFCFSVATRVDANDLARVTV